MAARYRITAPVEGVVSTVAGVAFAASVGETDSENAVAYFRRHGYQVVEISGPDPAESPVVGESGPELVNLPPGVTVRPEPPAGNATQEAWADWVLANVEGVDEDQVRAMKRDELREQYGPTAE